MNSNDLTDIRTDRTSLLTQTCTVKRPSTDSDGISTGAYTTVATGVACRVQWPGSGAARSLNNSMGVHAVAAIPGVVTIAFPQGQDVQTGDLIVIGSASYQVAAIHNEGPQNFGLTVDAQMQRAQ